jgi:hypothetical protein
VGVISLTEYSLVFEQRLSALDLFVDPCAIVADLLDGFLDLHVSDAWMFLPVIVQLVLLSGGNLGSVLLPALVWIVRHDILLKS